MKYTVLGFVRCCTLALAVMVALGTLMLAQPSHAAACVNGCIGLGVSAPTGLWEFATHIRTITVIGTTVRLVAPTVPTERDVSDPMALRSFAGHIDPTTEATASQRDSRYG